MSLHAVAARSPAVQASGMSAGERLKFYADLQASELQYKDQLLSSLSPFVGILTAVAGVAIYYWQHAPLGGVTFWLAAFYAIAIIGAGLAMLAAFYIALVLRGQAYTYLPSPDGIEAWYQQELASCAPPADADVVASMKLEQNLIRQLAAAAGANRRVNHVNSRRAYLGKLFTLLCILVLALSAFPFGMATRSSAATAAVGGRPAVTVRAP